MFSISAGCWYVGVQGARGAAVLCWSFQAATPSSWSVHHWKGGASWRCTQAWGDRPWRVRILEELLPRQQLNQVCSPIMKNCVYLLLVGRFLLYSGELLSFLSVLWKRLSEIMQNFLLPANILHLFFHCHFCLLLVQIADIFTCLTVKFQTMSLQE